MSDILPTNRRIYGIIREGAAGKNILHLLSGLLTPLAGASVIAIEL